MSELTTMDDALLASFGFGEGSTIKPTNLTLIQKSNGPDQVPGEFFDYESKFSYPKMNVVILKVTKKKKLKGEDDKPLCVSHAVSFNSKPSELFPITNNPELFPQDKGKGCSKCSKNQWVEINGKKIKPECADQYNVLLIDADTGIPYRIYAKGTAINSVKDYISTVEKAVMMFRAKGNKVTHLNFQTELSSSFIQKGKLSWYVPSFSRVTAAQPDAAHSALEAFKLFGVRQEAEDVEEGSDVVASVVENAVTDVEYVEV